MKRQQHLINIHNKHVKKMILLHLTPGAEEDKKHDDGTSSYLCSSNRKKHNTPLKSQNRSLLV